MAGGFHSVRHEVTTLHFESGEHVGLEGMRQLRPELTLRQVLGSERIILMSASNYGGYRGEYLPDSRWLGCREQAVEHPALDPPVPMAIALGGLARAAGPCFLSIGSCSFRQWHENTRV